MGKTVPFLRAKAPWIHLGVCSPASAESYLRATSDQFLDLDPFHLVRQVRGQKCANRQALFDEIAAGLQFPGAFGDNWDALLDCLRDLSWLRPKTTILAITDAPLLLKNAPAEQFHNFAAVLKQACADWNQAKKPRPFHVILFSGPEEDAAFRRRCEAAELPLQTLPLPQDS